MERRETNLIKHTNYIFEYENAVDEETLEYITSVLSSNFYDENECDLEINRNRKNKAYNLTRYKNKIIEVFETIEKIQYKYLSEYYNDCSLMKKYYSLSGSLASSPIYRFYDASDYYDWHSDNHEFFKFFASFLLYLNDDFVGGNTLFLNDKLKVTPKKGSVLMFPCGPYFLHKSTPITSGKKQIIWNCFMDIPNEMASAIRPTP